MMKLARISIAAATLAMVPFSANAMATLGDPTVFDNGYATTITYDDDISRNTANNRHIATNALGAADNGFFEIGRNSYVDLTFGTLFDTSVTVFEITFGNVAGYLETADIFVGLGDTFWLIDSITNLDAQGGATVGIDTSLIPDGVTAFDTVRVQDTSTQGGGFDIDAVRVTPVPLPAGLPLLGAGIVALGVFGRRKRAEA